ncbi:MAG: DUF4340 domain-containing protein [Planctomycetota bacterium]
MNDNLKTVIFVAVAVVLMLFAAGIIPGLVPGAQRPEIFNDEGEEFFPEFKDPLEATALEVIEFDSQTATPKPFRVEVKDGRWTIPSHHGYPADAKERMAKAAGLVIGLKKDRICSDNAADHKAYQVLDPTEENLGSEGRGTLVRFEDKGGNQVASLIIGKAVEGKSEMRYVRLPEKKRTYMVKVPGEVSTKFEDWIETDLLKVGSWDISRLVFNNYSIDETSGSIVPGERNVATKPEYDWTVEGLAEDEEPNKDALRDAATAVSGLKIVGVRPKPEGLTAQLSNAEGIKLDPVALLSLQSRGFFMGGGTLYSNEGELLVGSKKGVVRALRFGEIIYGAGESLSAGSDKEDESVGKRPEELGGEGEEKKETSLKASRYLMVTAHFDETLLKKPEGEPLPKEHLEKRKSAREAMEKVVEAVKSYKEKNEKLPETLALLTEAPAEGEKPLLESLEKDPWGNDYLLEPVGEGDFLVRSFGEDGDAGGQGVATDIVSNDWKQEDDLKKVADDHADYDKKVTEAKDEAKKLMERFAPWYYVIDDESFSKLHLSRAQIVKKKEAKPAEGEAKEGEDSALPEVGSEIPGDIVEPEGEVVPEPVAEPGKEPGKDGGDEGAKKDGDEAGAVVVPEGEVPPEPAKEPAKEEGGGAKKEGGDTGGDVKPPEGEVPPEPSQEPPKEDGGTKGDRKKEGAGGSAGG